MRDRNESTLIMSYNLAVMSLGNKSQIFFSVLSCYNYTHSGDNTYVISSSATATYSGFIINVYMYK